jgi:hypothetical protein
VCSLVDGERPGERPGDDAVAMCAAGLVSIAATDGERPAAEEGEAIALRSLRRAELAGTRRQLEPPPPPPLPPPPRAGGLPSTTAVPSKANAPRRASKRPGPLDTMDANTAAVCATRAARPGLLRRTLVKPGSSTAPSAEASAARERRRERRRAAADGGLATRPLRGDTCGAPRGVRRSDAGARTPAPARAVIAAEG